jgi:2-methylcitrate dehydratase PrpD
MAEPPKWPALIEALGESWELAHNSIKPYPCGFVIHPSLDCVLDWRKTHPGVAVERVVVRGNPLLAQRADRPDVSTGREAQVSVQHALAAALLAGRAELDQFNDECARDPAMVELRRKIEVVGTPALATVAAELELYTEDGEKHALSTAAARGSASNPLSDADIEQKLRSAAEAWQPGHDVEPLIEAVWALDRLDDVSRLLALTVPMS